MPSNFEDFLQAAEDHYLQPTEINNFKQQVNALQDRLALYELLREQELAIFQTVVDQLQKQRFSNTAAELEKVLTHWIAVLRYSAMAMLLNQPELLESQLLGWLVDILHRDEFASLNRRISDFLQQSLASVLDAEQIALIAPLLQKANTALVSEDRSRELAVLG
jgi:hypothetical protein